MAANTGFLKFTSWINQSFLEGDISDWNYPISSQTSQRERSLFTSFDLNHDMAAWDFMENVIQLPEEYCQNRRRDCFAAIRGEKVPSDFGHEVVRLCTVRGIRYHAEFGTELYALRNSMFNRALNARAIMSNKIPDMTEPDDMPYCIWHPDVASETTYRELARRYLQMRYNVGRACAVAGYIELFKELKLLPEISIAEEAREIGETGRLIFEDIMKQPVQYAVMDDYTRSVNLTIPRAGAYLNGDTAVRSLLEIKNQFPHFHSTSQEYSTNYYFNITEDWCIDEHHSEPREYRHVVPLLYTPLPLDLPTVDKDLLILMAAYYGDVDRYARLRRPKDCDMMMEYQCVVRGIYHNTMFAKWWSLQPNNDTAIHNAITARFIMNNDLSRIEEAQNEWECYSPYQIWYPNWAAASTYEDLVRRQPFMREPAARACIVADYQSSYEKLQPVPNYFLAEEAKTSRNKLYLEDLRKRGAEMGIDVDEYPFDIDPARREDVSRAFPTEHLPETLVPFSVPLHIINDRRGAWYDDLGANAGSLQLLVSLPDDLKPTYEYPILDVGAMYWQKCRPGENPRCEEHPGWRHPRR